MTRRPPFAGVAAMLFLLGGGVAARADSSPKEAVKQAGHAVGSAGRTIGHAAASAGREIGKQARHDAPPAWRSLRKNNRAFWQKRKADLKKAFGGKPASAPARG